MTDLTFAGKVCIVTGGSGGIGSATCRLLADRGAAVVVGYRSSRLQAEELVAEITSVGGRASAWPVDVTDHADVERTFDFCVRAYGGVDVLVNNAGRASAQQLLDIDPAQWRRTLGVNLDGVFHCTRAAVARMLGKGGTIVSVSSAGVRTGGMAGPDYIAAKGGVEALMRSVAAHYAREGIRANTVAAPLTDTAMARSVLAETGSERTAAESTLPRGRMARPDEVAESIAFLASPRSHYITGETLWM